MINISVPMELDPGESRVALTPEVSKKLIMLGAEVSVEKGLGRRAGIADSLYEEIGAQVTPDRERLLRKADLLLRVKAPPIEEISHLKGGSCHVSYLDPFNERKLVETLAAARISAVSMEMIPRITRAQGMDALSSQASLGGYVAVILAAERLAKIFPMMMTAAGTISPAKVFIIGAGVAGLQAIATAKRLGAKVEAFDTRPVVEEQVQSLGAKFVKIDLGETGQTEGGYARALTEEQLEMQREGMKKVCAQSDVVITTAQVFGRKAPVIVTEKMVEAMAPGSVIIDMAVESGGNVEGSERDREVVKGGVRIVGLGNLPGRVAIHASQMYASNLFQWIRQFWDSEKKRVHLDREDEIIIGSLITHEGEVVNATIKEHMDRERD